MQDSPAQSPEAGGEEGEGSEPEGVAAPAEPDSEPPSHPQIEAISSGTEREYTTNAVLCYSTFWYKSVMQAVYFIILYRM